MLSLWKWEWTVVCVKQGGGNYPDSKVHGAQMGPIWDRQDPGGLHVGPMNFAIWVGLTHFPMDKMATIPRRIFSDAFLAATKQLNEWYFPSVCLSVCLSVCPSVTPFWLCSHHQIIMKFPGVITNDKSDVHAKGQGQRSKVKVTEVMTPFSRFRTVTPVWIHILLWNYAYSLMLLRTGALLFFKVIRQISRSHG